MHITYTTLDMTRCARVVLEPDEEAPASGQKVAVTVKDGKTVEECLNHSLWTGRAPRSGKKMAIYSILPQSSWNGNTASI